MNNIFEGAKFGDKFLTRDGRIALFHRKEHGWIHYIIADSTMFHYVKEDSNEDIVSRYIEPIDEKKLDELAYESIPEYCYEPASDYMCETWKDAYKVGYKKAMEERL